MNKRVIVRFIGDVLIIIILVGFILSLLWYTTGSLETMPTEEQQEKVRTAAVLSMIVTGVPCMISTVIRRRTK